MAVTKVAVAALAAAGLAFGGAALVSGATGLLGGAAAPPLRDVSATVLRRASSPLNVGRSGLAVSGYDVVAYHLDNAAVPGRPEFEHRWNGAVWRFAGAPHRDEFARDPQRYAPQFGGYCAWAVSRGYTADIDPEAWRSVDGKLYLNYSKRVQRMWEQDLRGNIARGEANWPGVVSK